MHQHAANAQKKPTDPAAWVARGAGRPRKSTPLSTPAGLPIALKLTEGQAHDGRAACDMLGSLGAGNILLADAAYDSDALRQTLAERGAWANVKPMPRRRHVLAFSSFIYRYRNRVERFFNKLKHFRAVATRYDKNPENYLAAIKLASARIGTGRVSRPPDGRTLLRRSRQAATPALRSGFQPQFREWK